MNPLIEIMSFQLYRNVIDALSFSFEHVVFLVGKDRISDFKKNSLTSFLMNHGVKQIEYIHVEDDAQQVFDKLLKRYPDAVYHCYSGGGKLSVDITRHCEKNDCKFYTYDYVNDEFHDLNGCSDLLDRKQTIHLSIEEMISLADGQIRKTFHSFPNQPKMIDLMNKIIGVMNSDSSAWAGLLSVISREVKIQNPSSPQLVFKNLSSDEIRLLERLSDSGALSVKQNRNVLQVTFKSHQLMKMFCDSGAWLEYQAYLECLETGTFDDVRISTIIDWNRYSDDVKDPTCEIDLIVIDDCIPMFVSCKLNKCTALDLYEVKLLSKKLGGSMGKAAVISKAPSLRKGEPLYYKAMELDIKIIGEKEINAGKIAESIEQFLESE